VRKEDTNREALLLSRPEAAKRLNVSVHSVDRAIERGELKSKRLGGRVLVPVAEIERYAQGRQPIRVARMTTPQLALGPALPLEHDETGSKLASPHAARFARHPLPRAGEGTSGAENPFSRSREKVAGNSRTDEGSPRDSFKNHPALEGFWKRMDEQRKPVPPPRLALGREEAAKTLGLGARTIDRAISRGELKVYRHGRRVLISMEEIERYLTTITAPRQRGE
jgi:excisionase family DNA binding protein